MRIYNKKGITVDVYENKIEIQDESNSGYISCAPDNISNLINGLKQVRKDVGEYEFHNALNGRIFFPTIGCNGNYITLSHIPRIITAIRHSNKISFNINSLDDLSLNELGNIVHYIQGNKLVIKNDIVDIILYNI